MEKKEELREYMVKILDFAYAISLDKDNNDEGIAKTMAEEIQLYGVRILEIIDNDN